MDCTFPMACPYFPDGVDCTFPMAWSKKILTNHVVDGPYKEIKESIKVRD